MVKRILKTITEDTGISISVVMIIVGIVIWVTEVKLNADDLAKNVSNISQKQDAYSVELQKIDERLSRIEGKLDKDLNGN
jgi:hypothetical protein